MKVAVAETKCKVVLQTKRDDEKIVLTLELHGLPDVVMERIEETRGELTLPLLTAVLTNLSGGRILAAGVGPVPESIKSVH